MLQKEYWDKVASEKNFTTPFQVDLFQKYVDKNSIILDVGCGYGRVLSDLYGIGYKRIIGVDTSNEMVKRGKAQFPYLDLRYQESNIIDLKEDSVDAVILFGVLCCTPDDSQQEALISEISRVLKPNGVVYINDFLINKDLRNAMRYKRFEEKYNCYGVFELDDGCVLKHYDEKRIAELLSAFKLEKYEKVRFKTMNGAQSNGFYFIGFNNK